MPFLTRVALTVALLAAPLTLAASGWTTTFTSDLVGTYFDRGANVMIVPAGPAAASLDAATAAFDAALRASGKAQLVMDSKSLGAVADLDDAAIVGKAKAFPVAYVAVLRVFGGAGGASAVITVYDKKGNAAFALSGNEGTPLPARAGGAGGMAVSNVYGNTPTQGSGRKVVAPSDEGVAGGVVGGAGSGAQEEFEQKVIFFEDYRTVGMNQYGNVVSSYDWARAYQGKYKKPLLGADFYDALGKTEVAKRYREIEDSNGTWMTIAIGAGVATLVGGFAWMYAGITSHDSGSMYGVIGGTLLATLGAPLVWGLVAFAGHENPDPFDMPAKRKLVDEYNRALKARLQLGLAPTPGGAQVAMSGSF